MNAFVNGAYSIFPGVGNALYELARYGGLMGSEEFWRADQESRAIGAGIEEAWKNPKEAFNVADKTLKTIGENEPLFGYYLAGRVFMGTATGLGPAAAAGDTLWKVQQGHDFLVFRV